MARGLHPLPQTALRLALALGAQARSRLWIAGRSKALPGPEDDREQRAERCLLGGQNYPGIGTVLPLSR